jgi:hypothetical protein
MISRPIFDDSKIFIIFRKFTSYEIYEFLRESKSSDIF